MNKTDSSTPTTAAAPWSWPSVRDRLRQRREARAAHRNLKRELASYNTPAAVDDLLAMLRGESGPDAERIRTILAGNLQASARRLVA